jgi:hypothetical protein
VAGFITGDVTESGRVDLVCGALSNFPEYQLGTNLCEEEAGEDQFEGVLPPGLVEGAWATASSEEKFFASHSSQGRSAGLQF